VGLYLCVFEEDDELDGVEVGTYADFGFFRECVAKEMEDGRIGSKYPTLMLHSDCDGVWAPSECEKLKAELRDVSERFKQLPPVPFQAEWQKQVASLLGLKPKRLFDSFIDIDGEPLLERLEKLCDVAIENDQPILFQ